MSKKYKLAFNHNWNGKLFCTCFTSVRLRNDEKYQVGRVYQILVNGKDGGDAILTDLRHLKIDQLNDFICLLDAAYNKEDFTKMIRTMYKNIVTNWETQQLSLLLFRRTVVDKKIADTPKTITYKASTKKAV